MRNFFERHRPLYQGEGAGAGTGSGAGAGGDAGGQGGGGPGGGGSGAGGTPGTGGAGGDPPFWQRYEVPDGMRGTSPEEAFAKLHEGWKGLRDKVATLGPPKDPKDYAFEPGDKLKPYFKGSEADNKMLDMARTAAHKLGMPASQFGAFVNEFFTAAVDGGMMPAAFNPQAHIEAIGKLVAGDKTGPEAKAAIEAALTEAEAFAPALADSLKLSPQGKQALVFLADDAGGVELLRALKGLTAEKGLQLGGESRAQQGYGWADYDRDVADPRYHPFSSKFDKAWREGVDNRMRALPSR